MYLRVLKKLALGTGTKIGQGLGLLAIIIVPLMAQSGTLYASWHWFLMPLGLPYLKFWHSIGVMLCVHTVMSGKKDLYLEKDIESKSDWEKIGVVGFIILFRCVWIFAIGLALHLFTK